MHLTTHTDYALRVLIALALAAPEKLTVRELGEAYDASEHHLTKVVQKLSALGYVTTTRGKSGGVALRAPPRAVNLGQVVREVESDLGVVACLRRGGSPCIITPACKLKSVLELATERFLSTLGEYTLADVIENRDQLGRLLGVRLSRLGPGALAP
jgi:Rrf2 family nitric oxide-sensitive transcriptional repressor